MCSERPSRYLLLSFALLLYLSVFPEAVWCQKADTGTSDLALVGGRIYPSPTAAAIDDGVVLVRGDKIVAIGKRGQVKVPKSAQVIDCTGKVITAGFWNSHVHFTEPAWNGAATAPADKLEQHMQEMLTRWGFTTVWDIGSVPRKHTGAAQARGLAVSCPGRRSTPLPARFLPRTVFRFTFRSLYASSSRDLRRRLRQPLPAWRWSSGDGRRWHQTVYRLYHGTRQSHPDADDGGPRGGGGGPRARQAGVRASPKHAGTDNALAAGVDILAHTIPEEGDYTRRASPHENAAYGADSNSDIVGGRIGEANMPRPKTSSNLCRRESTN